jgi:hypothetical protein
MAASRELRGRTRLDRARSVVARLHASTRDVPSGVAGLTDRVLPYLFPTVSAVAFDETLARSVKIESPPPQQVSINATSFGALASLGRDGFFDGSASHRTCVLVTDAETKPYSSGTVARSLAGDRGCRLLVVRVGSGDERVFGADGRPEPGYVPDPAAPAAAEQLAEVAGGRAFDEGDLGAAASALRTSAEAGPTRRASGEETSRPLSAYFALAALVLTVGLALIRLRRPALHMIRTYA